MKIALVLSALCLLLASATAKTVGKEKVVAKVVFADGKAPKGWKKFKKNKLSKGAKIQSTTEESLSAEFRGFASKKKSFSYTQNVKPGTYKVLLGFAETEIANCKKKKRVFQVQVNDKNTGAIDVFKSVKCNKPHVVTVTDIVVGKNKKLIITLTRVSGADPFISNFQLLSGGGDPDPTDPSPGEKVVARYLDVGGLSDEPKSVVGTTQIYPNVVPISGTDEDAKYSKHRFAMDFSYVLKVQSKITYNVELFFAESFLGACGKGLRIFDVTAYDGGKSVKAGKSLKALDIFSLAGCRAAYSTEITGIEVGSSGKLGIRFMSVVENAMISAIKVTTSDAKYKATPTPIPPAFPLEGKDLAIDAGGPGDVPMPLPGTGRFIQDKPVMPSKGATEKELQTSRTGPDFQYTIDAAPGQYTILLSFAELFDPNFCNAPGSRMFDVYINGKAVVKKLDIYARVGCLKGLDLSFKAKVNTSPLTIRFSSVKSFAMINYIKITKK